MHGNMPNKGSEDRKEVKRKPYAAGHDMRGTQGSLSFHRVFLLLVSLHASIFIINWNPTAGLVLLLALMRGWLNGI